MGLASALSTALTGLSAAETTIDVVGNNLANSNTVGFKESSADFATQFLQTMSLGSAPSDNSGGTNPRQTGLGTMVAEITPNFKQGTIQVSSTPTDLAIQDEGFFMLEGASSEILYSRNGQFKLNSQNSMVSITGQKLLGYGVDANFQIDRSILRPVSIPLGSTAVAQATQNVFLQGQLSPTGDVADTAERIQTMVLGTSYYSAPLSNALANQASLPVVGATGQGNTTPDASGVLPLGNYEYKFVYSNVQYVSGATMPPLSEGDLSSTITATVGAGQDSARITGIPTPTSADKANYTYVRVYRRVAGATTGFKYAGQVAAGTGTFVDKGDVTGPTLNTDELNGKYTYYVTFASEAGGPPNGIESRPCLDSPATYTIADGRIVLHDLPKTEAGDTTWTVRRVYRSLASDNTKFYYLGEIGSTASDATLIDNTNDDTLKLNRTLNMDGPQIKTGTKLVDVLSRGATGYTHLFQEGTLAFQGQKGGRTLATKSFEITTESTVQDLTDFMVQSMGVQSIGSSKTSTPGEYVPPGGSIENGKIILTGNNGVDNRINIDLSGMTFTAKDGTITNVDMGWNEKQAAIGNGAVTDTVVYDSLGTNLALRITMELESRNSTETTYRWFADSSGNVRTNSAQIAVGSGTVTFDSNGNFKRAEQNNVNIYRDGYPAVNPLTFKFDFSQISGLANDTDSLAVSRQDGSAAGTLNSYIVGEDGVITGVFSSGVSRDLGQIELARFANPNGLQQRGQNLFAQGVNSGLPIVGDPGSHGIGSLQAGAVELSNTDVGGNLIDPDPRLHDLPRQCPGDHHHSTDVRHPHESAPLRDRGRNNCRTMTVGHVFNVPRTMESCATYCFRGPKRNRRPLSSGSWGGGSLAISGAQRLHAVRIPPRPERALRPHAKSNFPSAGLTILSFRNPVRFHCIGAISPHARLYLPIPPPTAKRRPGCAFSRLSPASFARAGYIPTRGGSVSRQAAKRGLIATPLSGWIDDQEAGYYG